MLKTVEEKKAVVVPFDEPIAMDEKNDSKKVVKKEKVFSFS